jgi:hypothetical protein
VALLELVERLEAQDGHSPAERQEPDELGTPTVEALFAGKGDLAVVEVLTRGARRKPTPAHARARTASASGSTQND